MNLNSPQAVRAELKRRGLDSLVLDRHLEQPDQIRQTAEQYRTSLSLGAHIDRNYELPTAVDLCAATIGTIRSPEQVKPGIGEAVIGNTGARLKVVREMALLTGTDFGLCVGLDQTAISKRENGKVSIGGFVWKQVANREKFHEAWILNGKAGDQPDWIEPYENACHNAQLYPRFIDVDEMQRAGSNSINTSPLHRFLAHEWIEYYLNVTMEESSRLESPAEFLKKRLAHIDLFPIAYYALMRDKVIPLFRMEHGKEFGPLEEPRI
jgi:hypothetical protein